jgi:hypothetical protein
MSGWLVVYVAQGGAGLRYRDQSLFVSKGALEGRPHYVGLCSGRTLEVTSHRISLRTQNPRLQPWSKLGTPSQPRRALCSCPLGFPPLVVHPLP